MGPPVATLPRCPMNDNLEVRTTNISKLKSSSCIQNNINTQQAYSSTTKRKSCIINQHETLLIDLLAFAHINNNKDNNSWKFCPNNNNKSQEDVENTAAPWGIGDRRCPAGSLSVGCIVAAIDTLRDSGYTWKLTNP